MLDLLDRAETVRDDTARVAYCEKGISPQESEERFHNWLLWAFKTRLRTTLSITPEQAAIMLKYNTGNRTMSEITAKRFAASMKKGAWKLTGEAIIFSDAGILNDGQTRLRACIVAGVPFTTHVTFGIERAAFDVTGQSRRRTLGDVFSIMQVPHANRLAAGLNWLHKYLHGWGGTSLSHEDGIKMLAENPDIERSCPVAQHHLTVKLITPSSVVFLHYIFALKDTDQANKFFDYLTDGVCDGETINDRRDPRCMLRQRLLNNLSNKAKLSDIEVAALTVKAWNAHREKKVLGALKWITNPSQGTPEAFPKAV